MDTGMLSEVHVRPSGSRRPRRMRRAVLICLSIPLVLGGCDGVASNTGEGLPRRRDPLERPVTTVLPKLKLRADLSEAPAKWRLIASIPFGPRRDQLGFFFDRRKGSLPLLPRSFAVAEDGSFWVLDGIKRRVTHFSRTGEFIEDVGGFRADRFSPRPKDVAEASGRLYVIEEERGRGMLTTIEPQRRRVPMPLKDGSHPVAVSLLLPATGRLVAHIAGYADPPGTGPTGFAELPFEESLRLLPGVPIDHQTWIDMRATGDQDLQFVSRRGHTEAIQPIHISVRGGSPPRKISALVGAAIEAVGSSGVGIYVRVTPAKPAEAKRFGGGSWYLRLGGDRSPVLWERLRHPGISAEEQVRHLAAGADGRIYLMVPDARGENIYMREDRPRSP